jgi:hypothetical protein
MEVMINNQINIQIDLEDLFHLELMEWIQSFNENNIMKMNGKQIIRIMLRVVKRLEQTPRNEADSYRNTYESWKQKIWAVEETEWEYQPELINFIYHEIQLMKNQQGLLDS